MAGWGPQVIALLADPPAFAARLQQAESGSGMPTQGCQGGRAAPLASRLHRIPTHFSLNLYGI